MRRVLICATLGVFLAISSHPAMADDGPKIIPGVHPLVTAEARPQSPLGGGFIELILTGTTHPAPAAPSTALGYDPQAYAPRADYTALAVEGRPESLPPPQYRRQEVDFASSAPPGAIVIDTPNRFLYLIEPGGKAVRYGVGVGRPGFEWAGVKTVSRKAVWPDWTPPSAMLKRRPDLPPHMDGGEGNPLGARALYLGSSEYRIHGTNEPWTIGQNVSSGCIRMMNEDVIDLYDRVKVGTKVTVM